MNSYWDDYTEEERQKMKDKMLKEHQTWQEILDRFGHPKDWPEAEQLTLL